MTITEYIKQNKLKVSHDYFVQLAMYIYRDNYEDEPFIIDDEYDLPRWILDAVKKETSGKKPGGNSK